MSTALSDREPKGSVTKLRAEPRKPSRLPTSSPTVTVADHGTLTVVEGWTMTSAVGSTVSPSIAMETVCPMLQLIPVLSQA